MTLIDERFEIEYEQTSFGWNVSIWDRKERRYVVFCRWFWGERDRAQRKVAAIIANYDKTYIKVNV